MLGGPQLRELALRLSLPGPGDLGDPALGSPVATSRSSWVRRVEDGTDSFFAKTYVYRTAADRLRGALRFTGPHRPSRARREARALLWLRAAGFEAPAVVGVWEERRLGWLCRAVLVTEAWPGQPLDRLLPQLPAEAGRALARALGRLVAALHRAGFRDGNLDLRNVLARQTGGAGEGAGDSAGGWQFAKVDSPRHALVRPGARDDRRARADWARLLPQLAAFGLADEALHAAGRL